MNLFGGVGMVSRLFLPGLVFCLSLLTVSSAFGATLFEKFYAERETLVSIPFEKGGTELTAGMAASFESSLEEMRKIDPEDRLIRVEGFLGQQVFSDENYGSALHRANAVARYLEKSGVMAVAGVTAEVSRYGEGDESTVSPWVEIVSYPKIRELEGTVKISLDGAK